MFQINGIEHSGTIETADYKIEENGDNIVIKNKHCDLEATYNGKHTAKVYIGKKFGLDANGLCGNCDGVKNDYRTSDGTDVSEFPDKYARIGNSYLVPMPDETDTE